MMRRCMYDLFPLTFYIFQMEFDSFLSRENIYMLKYFQNYEPLIIFDPPILPVDVDYSPSYPIFAPLNRYQKPNLARLYIYDTPIYTYTYIAGSIKYIVYNCTWIIVTLSMFVISDQGYEARECFFFSFFFSPRKGN